jgi:hypothetical protein
MTPSNRNHIWEVSSVFDKVVDLYGRTADKASQGVHTDIPIIKLSNNTQLNHTLASVIAIRTDRNSRRPMPLIFVRYSCISPKASASCLCDIRHD